MTCKIQINIHEGTIHAEGDAGFVKEVYSDFKTHLIEMIKNTSQPHTVRTSSLPESPPQKQKTRKRTPPRKPSTSADQTTKINPDNPTLDKNLDTTGVKEFYAQYAPKNHPEKILIFLQFLTGKLEIGNPNINQIYTCYNAVGEKPATAFSQSFRDTSSKKFGFIEYASTGDISLTFIGKNYFNHDLKKGVINE